MELCELPDAEERDDIDPHCACALHDLSPGTQREAEVVIQVEGGGGPQRLLRFTQSAGAAE